MLQFVLAVQSRRKNKSFFFLICLIVLIAALVVVPKPVDGGAVDVGTVGEEEDDDKRLWGTSSSAAAAAAAAATTNSIDSNAGGSGEVLQDNVVDNGNNSNGENGTSGGSRDSDQNSGGSTSSPTIPFVAKASSGSASSSTSSTAAGGSTNSSPTTPLPPQQQKHNEHHYDIPLQGFQLTSRVYTDPDDKLAHFDNDVSSQLILPYWECGVSGSTTASVPAQHVTIRHLLASSKPNRYIGTEYGPHPQLLVALTPIDIVLNSGQTQTFAPGDVVLMEDVVSDGHKIVAASTPAKRGVGPMNNSPKTDLHAGGSDNPTVMIVTLSQTYHHTGKDKISLQQHTRPIEQHLRANPCKNIMPGQEGLAQSFNDGDEENDSFVANALSSLKMPLSKQDPRAVRKTFLAIIGVSVSALIGDFFGKVAPLWLAVGVGGVCFVTGGTVAFVQVGDYCIEEFEMWSERRRLRLGDGDDKENNEDEEEDNENEPPIPFVGAL